MLGVGHHRHIEIQQYFQNSFNDVVSPETDKSEKQPELFDYT